MIEVGEVVSLLMPNALELSQIDDGCVLVLAHQAMTEICGICVQRRKRFKFLTDFRSPRTFICQRAVSET